MSKFDLESTSREHWQASALGVGARSISNTLACASRFLLLISLGAALSGCAPYHKQFPLASLPTPGYDLQAVQVDDFGTFWDAHHANDVLASVDASSQKTNTFVVLFIHGWHHNADPEDTNLRDFNETLKALYQTLRGESRTALRKQLTGDANFQLIGIYVGWRGRALRVRLRDLSTAQVPGGPDTAARDLFGRQRRAS